MIVYKQAMRCRQIFHVRILPQTEYVNSKLQTLPEQGYSNGK